MPGGSFLQVASGTDFSCAIDANHLLACWGRIPGSVALSVPSLSLTQVAARRRLACGLDPGGHVLCFNLDGDPVAAAPADRFTQIGVGGDFACGLRDDGRHEDGPIVCWSTIPGQPLAASDQAPEGRFTAISIGATSSCAVDTSGAIDCWGADPLAGRSPLVGLFSDVSVSGGGGTAPVEGTHGCARRVDGTLTCWGYEGAGQAVAPTGVFRQVSVGLIHTCAIQLPYLNVVCWGDRGSGETNPPNRQFNEVAAGFGFSCGVEVGGAASLGRYRQIGVGLAHTCAITSPDGSILCWGANTWGESSPPAGGGYRQVTVGDSAGGGGAHSCALASDSHVICWGDHSFGKCTPPDARFWSIDAAENYTCGVSTTGQVWCWGLQARQPID